jgi:hypothetical protein
MADYERAQTVEAPAGALFEFLADVGNLPRCFERMTAAEPADGEAVRVRAEIDGREQEGRPGSGSTGTPGGWSGGRRGPMTTTAGWT